MQCYHVVRKHEGEMRSLRFMRPCRYLYILCPPHTTRTVCNREFVSLRVVVVCLCLLHAFRFRIQTPLWLWWKVLRASVPFPLCSKCQSVRRLISALSKRLLRTRVRKPKRSLTTLMAALQWSISPGTRSWERERKKNRTSHKRWFNLFFFPLGSIVYPRV